MGFKVDPGGMQHVPWVEWPVEAGTFYTLLMIGELFLCLISPYLCAKPTICNEIVFNERESLSVNLSVLVKSNVEV